MKGAIGVVVFEVADLQTIKYKRWVAIYWKYCVLKLFWAFVDKDVKGWRKFRLVNSQLSQKSETRTVVYSCSCLLYIYCRVCSLSPVGTADMFVVALFLLGLTWAERANSQTNQQLVVASSRCIIHSVRSSCRVFILTAVVLHAPPCVIRLEIISITCFNCPIVIIL